MVIQLADIKRAPIKTTGKYILQELHILADFMCFLHFQKHLFHTQPGNSSYYADIFFNYFRKAYEDIYMKND